VCFARVNFCLVVVVVVVVVVFSSSALALPSLTHKPTKKTHTTHNPQTQQPTTNPPKKQQKNKAIGAAGVKVLKFDDLAAAGKAAPAAAVPPKPEDYCTIMYTSGTTGERGRSFILRARSGF
jgi:long-subunit acyl-CoA synthetase (AMP-forming)